MPFDTADPADTFPSDDPSAFDGPPTKAYPAPPPLAPLSSLLGYTPADLTRYTTAQHAATSRLLSLPLTPTEQHALAYYDSIFYTYESYGDTLGSAAGALLGSALSLRPPGRIPAAVAVALRLPPRAVATVLRITIFASLGRLYGLTTAGVQALARMRAEQQRDPAMVRVVAARAGKAAALERELRARVVKRGEGGVADGGDAHSLGGGGGGGMAELRGRSDEDVVSDEREAFPFGRPSEAVAAQMEGREGRADGEDPFSVVEGEGEAGREGPRGAPVRGGWRNNHSATGESTWERLRRGQLPRQQTRQGGEEEEGVQPQQQSSSPWPQRAPMKGFGGAAAAGGGEPKTDSFSFSRTTEERELAKAQAQKEFDESVERERRSASGDGYSEGDQGGRAAGRW